MSFPQPPAYGGGQQLPFSAPRAIGWGWRKFRQFFGPVMVGVAIYVGLNVAAGIVSALVTAVVSAAAVAANDLTVTTALQSLDAAFQISSTLGGSIANMVLSGAAARAALDVADGRQYDFLNALRRVPILKIIGATLLSALVIAIGLLLPVLPLIAAAVLLDLPRWAIVAAAIVVVLPAIALSVLLYLTRWVVVDEPSVPVTDALRLSASLVRTNLGNAILTGLLVILVMAAGILACCVGVLAAYPITIFATANAYRRFRDQSVAP